MAVLLYRIFIWILLRLPAPGVLALCWWSAGYAQERNARFQHLTIEDGLPQDMVDCILQDRQGFMWFGAWNGLCRYDG